MFINTVLDLVLLLANVNYKTGLKLMLQSMFVVTVCKLFHLNSFPHTDPDICLPAMVTKHSDHDYFKFNNKEYKS